MNLLETAQRRSRRAMHQWCDAREARRAVRNGAQSHMRDLVWASSERDKLRAELAKAQARLEVLERMLRDVGRALHTYTAAYARANENGGHWSHANRVTALAARGVLLARVDVAVRFACQTPVVEERA